MYVLDEPSAGLHPADTRGAADRAGPAEGGGELGVRGRARPGRGARAPTGWSTWAPRPGEHGGQVLHSGPVAALARRRGLGDGAASCSTDSPAPGPPGPREPRGPADGRPGAPGTTCAGVERASSRSACYRRHRSLRVRQVDADRRRSSRGARRASGRLVGRRPEAPSAAPPGPTWPPTPACSTPCARLFAGTEEARARGYGVGRFSFNVAGGRCETCQGEGFVSVELLFLPSTYAPCPDCAGARYNPRDARGDLPGTDHRGGPRPHRRGRGRVLRRRRHAAGLAQPAHPARGGARVPAARPARHRAVGGEAQRIKLASELQRGRARPHPLSARRADDRPASGRRRGADAAAARPGRRRSHRRGRRARHGGGGGRRLGHRHGPRGRRRGRAGRGRGPAALVATRPRAGRRPISRGN